MRERLIELVHDAICKYDEFIEECHKEDGVPLTDDFEYIADYLLENGVLVPPCKVGQKVWILRFKDEITEGNVYAIERYRDSRYPLWLGIEYEDEIEGIGCYNARADMVGKTIFLTREEAEAALKERSKNDKTE